MGQAGFTGLIGFLFLKLTHAAATDLISSSI